MHKILIVDASDSDCRLMSGLLTRAGYELMARPYQQRDTRYNFDELLANPLIKLITRPRRVGKSVFALLMLLGKNFAYLNFDDNLLLENWDEDLVIQMLDDVYPGYKYMLLDEIQNLPNWDLWVNKLYRRGKNLIITDSNAKMLSSEMVTVLIGRYLLIRWPSGRSYLHNERQLRSLCPHTSPAGRHCEGLSFLPHSYFRLLLLLLLFFPLPRSKRALSR